MFTAVLDTCVLYSAAQRDFFLSLAVQGLFKPIWNSQILEELRLCEIEKFVDDHNFTQVDAENRADRLIAKMSEAFDDSLISGWERLEGHYQLPDPHDEHVVAAAELANASALITANIKDFPQALMPMNVQVIEPAHFALTTVEINPLAASLAILEMASFTGRSGPKETPTEILDRLDRVHGFTAATSLLRQYVGT